MSPAQSLDARAEPLEARRTPTHRDTLYGEANLEKRYFLAWRSSTGNTSQPPQTVHLAERAPRPDFAITCAPHSAHSQRTPAIRGRGISPRDEVAVAEIAEVNIWNMV